MDKKQTKSIINVIRVIFHSAVAVLFVGLLVSTIGVLSVSDNITDRATVKSWVDDAEIYNKITTNSLSLLKSSDSEETLQDRINNSNIDAEAVTSSITDVFNGSFYSTSVAAIINGVYDRLEDQNADYGQYAFSISAENKANELQDSLGEVLLAQLNGIKVCDESQLEEFSGEFDPFMLECVPEEGFSASDEVSRYIAQIAEEGSFLGDIEVTDQTFFAQPDLINSYNGIKAAASVLPFVVLAFAIMFVAASKDVFTAVKNLGYLTVVIGIITVVIYSLGAQVAKIEYSVGDGAETSLLFAQDVVGPIIRNIVASISNTGLMLSFYVITAGATLVFVHYIIERFGLIKKKSNTVLDDSMDTLTVEEIAKQVNGKKPSPKTKKKKKPKTSEDQD